jgi:hypothetical protein
MKRLRYLLALGCACAVSVSLISCGDSKDDKSAATATTETAAPEDVLAPDAQVATGLTALKQVSVAISKVTDAAASKKASEGLEPVWQPVEGTVKKNEPDMYATIEEDLSLLESGDAAKTKTGAAEMGKTVDAYIAKHPG